MRYGLIRVLGAMVLGTTLASAGCGDTATDDGAATGGSGGGGGTSGGGNEVTTVNATATLSTLTQADAAKLCDDTYAYFRTAIPAATVCKWKGLSFATSSSAPSDEQLRANCSEKETQCLADPAMAFVNPGCSPFPANCGATVAEYSNCVKDEVAFFNQTVAELQACANFSSMATQPVWDAQSANPPASCTFATCQGLFPPNPLL